LLITAIGSVEFTTESFSAICESNLKEADLKKMIHSQIRYHVSLDFFSLKKKVSKH